MNFDAMFDTLMEMIQELPNTIAKIPAKVKKGMAILAEALTGRSCEKCDHFAKGSCWHPDFETRDKCTTGIRPVGFKKREE